MRLASFRLNGRTSYGAVTDGGIIDLGRKLSKYPTLLEVFRAQAMAEARAAATGPADCQLKDVELLPPIPAPDKNICVGINYPDRSAEYKDGREAPKYPNLFCRFPTSLVGAEAPIVRPKVSDKFDYEGEIVLVIGKEGRHVPREQALGMIGGFTLGNEGSVRDWLRHGTLNVTQGKNFDKSGSVGPWVVTDRRARSCQAASCHDAGERRAAPGRHHRSADLGLRLADQLHLDLRDAQARRLYLDRNADRRRRAPQSAGLARARRRGRSRGAGDRRAAQ